MSVSRGDIVLIHVPFVSHRCGKTRPMLVVQNNNNNQRMQNTIVATITSNIRRAPEPTQVLLDVATPDGRQTGLLATSVVSTENLLTVRQAHVRKTIGCLSASLMRQGDDALKVSLALP
jgi:mRNA interferase MazF